MDRLPPYDSPIWQATPQGTFASIYVYNLKELAQRPLLREMIVKSLLKLEAEETIQEARQRLLENFDLDLRFLIYDTTNYYTYIDLSILVDATKQNTLAVELIHLY